MALIYIGLGANLGDRSTNIKNAKDELIRFSSIKIIKESAILETEPVDFMGQPRFLNQAILIQSDLTPLELLRNLKKIETKIGRKKTVPKGPRIIDMDILLYDDVIVDTEELKIPHEEIKNRRFVLEHLIEIDPDIADPLTGEKYIDTYE